MTCLSFYVAFHSIGFPISKLDDYNQVVKRLTKAKHTQSIVEGIMGLCQRLPLLLFAAFKLLSSCGR